MLENKNRCNRSVCPWNQTEEQSAWTGGQMVYLWNHMNQTTSLADLPLQAMPPGTPTLWPHYRGNLINCRETLYTYKIGIIIYRGSCKGLSGILLRDYSIILWSLMNIFLLWVRLFLSLTRSITAVFPSLTTVYFCTMWLLFLWDEQHVYHYSG